ncbi:uncharacterized protein LOC135311648 [Phalacrocorax carbo]|uniref:uncharacterized protein LOC135311648 n=1 Tax=Phalacrocorax carbo TaxID=9209 RepID=UPI003119C464
MGQRRTGGREGGREGEEAPGAREGRARGARPPEGGRGGGSGGRGLVAARRDAQRRSPQGRRRRHRGQRAPKAAGRGRAPVEASPGGGTGRPRLPGLVPLAETPVPRASWGIPSFPRVSERVPTPRATPGFRGRVTIVTLRAGNAHNFSARRVRQADRPDTQQRHARQQTSSNASGSAVHKDPPVFISHLGSLISCGSTTIPVSPMGRTYASVRSTRLEHDFSGRNSGKISLIFLSNF